MRKITSLITFAILLFSTTLIAGGAWVKPKGEGFFMLTQRFLAAEKYYNPDGEVVDLAVRVSNMTTNIYGEYGLGNNLEFNITAPLVYYIGKDGQTFTSGNPENPKDSELSMGDMILGLKYGLLKDKPVNWSLAYRLKIPFGNEEGGETGLLQTGNGIWEHKIRTDLSGAVSSKLYFSGYTSFNKRNSGFSDELYYGVESGYGLGKSWIIAKLDGLHSFRNGDIEEGGSALFSNNIEYFAWTLEGLIGITDKWGADLAVNGVFGAKNVLAAPAYQIGVYYNLKKKVETTQE